MNTRFATVGLALLCIGAMNLHAAPEVGSGAEADRAAAVISEELALKEGTANEKKEDPPVIRLWPIEQVGGEAKRLKQNSEDRGGGKMTYRNIEDPNLTVYQAESNHPTPAVL